MSSGVSYRGDILVPYTEEQNGKQPRTAKVVLEGYFDNDYHTGTGAFEETKFGAEWADGEQLELTADELNETIYVQTNNGVVAQFVGEYLDEQVGIVGTAEPVDPYDD